MKVLFHFNASPALMAWLKAQVPSDWDLVCCPENDAAAFAQHWPGTHVLWHVLQPVTAARIQANPALRLVQKIGVGVNTIDLPAAAQQGVAVCNMPGVNSRAVAEMSLGLMLMAARRMGQIAGQLRQGQWPIPEAQQAQLFELGGKTVGLVGTGHVPRLLAPWLQAMGVKVLGHSRNPGPEWRHPNLPLNDLLAQSDVVSLHIPLTPETQAMFNAQRFAAFKRGAILVNTARGELVDEVALIHALEAGQLSLACLDVFAQEPLPADHPLLQRGDVLATPHMAWLTQDMFQRALTVAIDNTHRTLNGTPLLHQVQ
jgi:phosphoglycerate dehydrogenase-like enzyme